MYKKITLLIILSLFYLRLFPQFADEGYYQVPDRKSYLYADVLGRGTKYTGDPGLLVKKLTDRFDNPYLKYKAIYSWIALNVTYNFDALYGRSALVTDPLSVLDSLTTVCAGYAGLMSFLCNLAGLECEVVTGWSKTTPKNLEGINWSNPDHAWNAFKINGEWRYCDATWGAGIGRENKKKEMEFVRDFTSGYFDVPIEKIFLQHYPKDLYWQNQYNMTKKEFDNLPLYDRSYFKTWTHGLYRGKKYLRKGLFCSVWYSFKSVSDINSISITGKQIAMPLLRLGNNYFSCFTLGMKDSLASVILNNEVILTYINK